MRISKQVYSSVWKMSIVSIFNPYQHQKFHINKNLQITQAQHKASFNMGRFLPRHGCHSKARCVVIDSTFVGTASELFLNAQMCIGPNFCIRLFGEAFVEWGGLGVASFS